MDDGKQEKGSTARPELYQIEGYSQVWGKLIHAEQEGLPLTADQKRALELRRINLDISYVLEPLMEDPSVKRDPIREANLTSIYWQSMLRLQDLGITPDMHYGEEMNPDNQKQIAEYISGQLIKTNEKQLPSIRRIYPQLREHSLEQAPVSDEQVVSALPIEVISPTLKDFFVLRETIGWVRNYMVAKLDTPGLVLDDPYYENRL